MRSPIAIFAYNRVDNLRKMFDSLRKCTHVNEHVCYIFCDQHNFKKVNDESSVNAVREYIKHISNENIFKETRVFFCDVHKGCERSVIEGLNSVLEENDRVIDIEDDLLLAENFLDYMDDALETFSGDHSVGLVSGFAYPLESVRKYDANNEGFLYMAKRTSSWGFGTWADRWRKVDWDLLDYDAFKSDKKMRDGFSEYGYDLPEMLKYQAEACLDTWDVQWCYALYKRNMKTVYPSHSFVYNIGFYGTHMKGAKIRQGEIDLRPKQYSLESVEYNAEIDAELRSFQMSKEEYDRHVSWLDNKMHRYYRIAERWLDYKEHGIRISKFFIEQNAMNVAIFGIGDMARHLIAELRDTGITVKYIIDNCPNEKAFEGLPVFDAVEEQWGEAIDIIVVTSIMDYRSICNMIKERTEKLKVLSIERLIFG